MRLALVLAGLLVAGAAQNQGIGAASAPGVSPDGVQKNLNTDDAGNLLLAPGQLTCVVGSDGGITIAEGAIYVLGGDGGFPDDPVKAESPGYTCCGTTATAIAYSTPSFHGLNLGPNAVCIFVDGGSCLSADALLSGTPNPTVSGGDSYATTAVGVPYLCQAYVASQTDGGCLTVVGAHQ